MDDHTKNFCFCMTPDGTWRLSPAYDLTYAVDLSAPAYMNRQSLSVNGKTEDIIQKDLETVAQRNDIRNYTSLIERVGEAVSKFKDFAAEININREIADRIFADFARR